MKTVTLLLTIFLFSSACSSRKVPRRIKKDFTLCLSGEKQFAFRTDGYYLEPIHYLKDSAYGNYLLLRKDTLCLIYVFYNNGMFFTSRKLFHFSENKYPTGRSNFFKNLLMNRDSSLTQVGFDWGIYHVVDSTVTMQAIHERVNLNDGWSTYGFIYKIINSHEILKSGVIFPKMPKSLKEYTIKQIELQKLQEVTLPAVFFPCDSIIPVQRSWLLKEQWLYCDPNKLKTQK